MRKLINKLHVFGAKSCIEKLSGFCFYRSLGLFFKYDCITQKLLDHLLWNKKQNALDLLSNFENEISICELL